MPPKRKSTSPAESGTKRTRVTEEPQEIAPSELSNEPSTSGTSTAPSEPTTTTPSIDLTATSAKAVAEGLKAAAEGLKAAAEAIKDVIGKPESTTPITLGNLFKQDMKTANILPYLPNSFDQKYLINKKEYRTYNKKAGHKKKNASQLLYPGRICLIAGNEFPILMENRPSDGLMAHWKKWLPQFPEPRFKTIDEGIKDEDPIVTVFPMEKIPKKKHAVDPDMHYHVLLKRAIPKTEAPHPEYFKEEDAVLAAKKVLQKRAIPKTEAPHPEYFKEEDAVLAAKKVLLKSAIPKTGAPHPEHLEQEEINRLFPCMVKVDQSSGGYSNYRANNPVELLDKLEKFKEDYGEGVPYVITEFVKKVKETLGCLFYLNKKGEVHWLGTSLNVLKDYAWVGCKVDWDLREYYRKRVYDLFIMPVAKYLHKKRYFGIVGIDIITSPSGDYLVDINARITGCTPHVLIAREMARKGLTKSLFKKSEHHECSTEELIKKANYANETTDGKILILNSMDVDEGCTAAIVAFGQTMTEVEHLFKCLTDENQNK